MFWLPDILVDACGWVAVIDAGINIDYSLNRIFGNYKFLLLPNVKNELKLIDKERSPHQPLLLDLLFQKAKEISPVDESSKHTDEQLLLYSEKNNTPVLTVDRFLKNRLHELNLSVLQVTGNNRLELVEWIMGV